MSPEDAYAIFECIARISGTMNCLKRTDPTGKEMEDEQAAAEARHGKFRFGMCGIKQGEKIQFADDSLIEAEVVDDRHVKYKEDICTLAGLARLLMKKPTGRVSAAKHFMYKGRLLSDIRKELEEMPHI